MKILHYAYNLAHFRYFSIAHLFSNGFLRCPAKSFGQGFIDQVLVAFGGPFGADAFAGYQFHVVKVHEVLIDCNPGDGEVLLLTRVPKVLDAILSQAIAQGLVG